MVVFSIATNNLFCMKNKKDRVLEIRRKLKRPVVLGGSHKKEQVVELIRLGYTNEEIVLAIAGLNQYCDEETLYLFLARGGIWPYVVEKGFFAFVLQLGEPARKALIYTRKEKFGPEKGVNNAISRIIEESLIRIVDIDSQFRCINFGRGPERMRRRFDVCCINGMDGAEFLAGHLTDVLIYGCRNDDGELSREYGKEVFVQEVSNHELNCYCERVLVTNEENPHFYSSLEYLLALAIVRKRDLPDEEKEEYRNKEHILREDILFIIGSIFPYLKVPILEAIKKHSFTAIREGDHPDLIEAKLGLKEFIESLHITVDMDEKERKEFIFRMCEQMIKVAYYDEIDNRLVNDVTFLPKFFVKNVF